MSATTPTGAAKAQGRSAVPSNTSLGVLTNELFRSRETKYILENHQSVQLWSKFLQRWLFHAPRTPVGCYTNASIDDIIANTSCAIRALSCISEIPSSAASRWTMDVTWNNCVPDIVSVCTIDMIVLNLARRYATTGASQCAWRCI